MKKETLIQELQKLPDGIDVKIFDHRKNLDSDCGDGSSEGIYSEFNIEIIELNGEDEKEYYKELHDKDFISWAALSFENEEYPDLLLS